MDKEIIIKVLSEREGYTQKQATILANECQNLSIELKPLLDKWLQNADEKGTINVLGYDLLEMMQHRKMHYMAALIDFDWLIKEPDKAKPVIDSFMR